MPKRNVYWVLGFWGIPQSLVGFQFEWVGLVQLAEQMVICFCREFWVVDILGFTLDGGMFFFCSVLYPNMHLLLRDYEVT